MVGLTSDRIVGGLRRRWRRWARGVRDALPRRLPAWQEPVDEVAAPVEGGHRPQVDLDVASVAELRRAVGNTPTPVTTARLHAVVRDWRAPHPGWSGRLGALPHLLSAEIVLPPGGRGAAVVRIGLAEPLPLHRIVAAVLTVLVPAAPLPRTASADVALDGPVPGWLPAGAVDRSPAGPDPDDAPVRPYDLRLQAIDTDADADTDTDAGADTAGPPAARRGRPALRLPAEPTAVGGGAVAVPVDAGWANPAGRRRYTARMPGGRLRFTERHDRIRWRIDRGAADPTVVVAGVAGDVLDPKQTGVLADLGTVVVDDAGPVAAPAYAAVVAQLAMTGLLVHDPRPPAAAADLLGAELAGLLAAAPPPAGGDPVELELASIRQRRAALRRHATGFALPRAAASAYPSLARPPAVSAVLTTRRPDRVLRAVADLAAQTYPEFEIVVALHGVAPSDELTAALADYDVPVHLVPLPGELSFGEALGEATRFARGSLVTKVDDDDRYGPEHLWDLVLARHYSGATVVGKGAEFVYLEPRGVTVRRRMGSEIFTEVVAGGTMLLGRGDLEAAGGWRPVDRSVDRALLDRVLHCGGLIYRTHGFGFLYVRHGDGHTWDPGLDYFLQDPARTWQGTPGYEEFGTP